MNLKKKIKAFFSFKRRSDGGFTLVELIVVIAILAILAGVGTAGYSGYIKNANKNADKALVGDIMRAIETGTNSTMFVNDDSFSLGGITFPVGFVALSTNNAAVIGSATEVIEGETGEDCEFASIPDAVTVINYLGEKTATCHLCGKTETQPIYKTDTYAAGTYTYCTKHSSGTPSVVPHPSRTTYYKALGSFTHWGSMCIYTKNPNEKQTIAPNKPVVMPSSTDHFYAKTASGVCEYAYSHQLDSFGGTHVVGNVESGAIYDSLIAAFGSLDSLRLKNDSWTSDDGVDYATFYLYADDMLDSVEVLGGNLATVCGITDLLGKTTEIFSRSYGSAEEFSKAFSTTFTTTYPNYDSWKDSWKNASGSTWSTEGFGLTGRENYSSVRKSYNMGFASYLQANDVPADIANVISNFSKNIGEDSSYAAVIEALGDMASFPALVNTSTFNDADSGLKEAINSAAASYEAAENLESGYYFELCKKLYQRYISSPACEENGKAFYETIAVIKSTESMAAMTGDYFGYYDNYVDEISSLYEAANTFSDNSVVVIVEVVDGIVQCRVSPNSANPRKD